MTQTMLNHPLGQAGQTANLESLNTLPKRVLTFKYADKIVSVTKTNVSDQPFFRGAARFSVCFFFFFFNFFLQRFSLARGPSGWSALGVCDY